MELSIFIQRFVKYIWPVDEYLFIEHAKNNNFETLYKEILGILTDTIKTFNSEINDFYGEESIIEIIKEACLLNNWLLNVPERFENSNMETFWNIGEAFVSRINGRFQSLERSKNKYNYTLVRKSDFNSFDEWLQNVVWYGNKKGDYLNDFEIKQQ